MAKLPPEMKYVDIMSTKCTFCGHSNRSLYKYGPIPTGYYLFSLILYGSPLVAIINYIIKPFHDSRIRFLVTKKGF